MGANSYRTLPSQNILTAKEKGESSIPPTWQTYVNVWRNGGETGALTKIEKLLRATRIESFRVS